MKTKFSNKKISGILSIVPKNKVKFIDEIDNYGFSREKSLNLQKVIGFNERRIVAGNECTSDLCLFGIEYLIANGMLKKDEIGALVFITQTPDYFMPPTSCVLHGKLGLHQDVACLDINQGCAGYLYGLLQAFLLLQISEIKKVVVLTGDTLSRKTYFRDRNAYPLVGDAASISIVENSKDNSEIYLNIKTDGSRNDWLIIPAGAFRMPSDEKTREIRVFPDGNQRSDEHFHMNGPGIFSFTMTDVPEGIKELFEFSSQDMNKIDYYMFHQPNRFILEKLAQKLGIPKSKMPNNIVEIYGNSSSATIPLTICHNLRTFLLEKRYKICISGFGVGLTWGALIMNLGPLKFCEIIEK